MKDNKMGVLDYLVFIFFLGLAFLMASCISEEDICTKQEITSNVVCIQIYDPVIAPDGTEYPNSCIAEADGWDNSCLILKEL
jgi:hypothetical protein